MPVMTSAPLTGRARELGTITGLLDRLVDGEGGTLLLEGPAGIGKTRLIEATLEMTAARGIETAHASADPTGSRRPFHVALSVARGLAADGDVAPDDELRALVDSVRAVPGPGTPVAPGSARVHVIDAIVAELERRARSPLVIVVDDLHHADDASLAALRAVLPLTAETALLVVATGRRRPAGSADRALREAFGRTGPVVELRPLPPDEIATIAAHLLEAPPGSGLREVLDESAGNPLLATELLRALAAENALHATGGEVGLHPDARSRIGTDVIDVHLATLDEATTTVLRCAAVLGPSATAPQLTRLSGRPPAEVAGAIERAVDAGLLVDDGRHVRIAHDLLRDAVYDRTPRTMRATLHQEAARLLAVDRRPAVLVARHAALGASPDEAVQWLRLAADDVMTLAPDTALEMLDEAARLAAPDPVVLQAVQRARVDSLLGTGRVDDALRLAELLCASMEPGGDRAELLVRIGGMRFVANQADVAAERHRQAAAEAVRPGVRALALAQQALALVVQGDLDGGESLARDAVTLADAVGDVPAQVAAESVLARVPCFSHRYRDGLCHAQRAVDLAERSTSSGPAHDYLPWFWLGVIALDLDDHATVEHAVQAGRDRAVERHSAWAEPLYAGLAASLAHRRGALDEAAALAESGVSLSIDTGSTQALVWCQSIAALVADRRGETAERDRWIAEADATMSRQGAALGVDHFAVASALVLEPGAAAAGLGATWDAFSAMGITNCQPLLAVPLVRATRTTDPARAEAAVAALETDAASADLAGITAVARHARGIVDGDVDGLVDTAGRYATLGRRLDEAEALADAARAARLVDDPRLATLQARATDAFAACDADPGTCLADLCLDDVGLEDMPGPARAQPSSAAARGWGSLTATERAVVDLVARGLTNSEIAEARHVSRRTIESHLVRVYAKVGFSSRTRLAVEAAEHTSPVDDAPG